MHCEADKSQNEDAPPIEKSAKVKDYLYHDNNEENISTQVSKMLRCLKFY